MLKPTLYSELLNRATNEPQQDIERRFKELMDMHSKMISEKMGFEMIGALRAVYMAGVEHGFSQGVAAAIPDPEKFDYDQLTYGPPQRTEE